MGRIRLAVALAAALALGLLSACGSSDSSTTGSSTSGGAASKGAGSAGQGGSQAARGAAAKAGKGGGESKRSGTSEPSGSGANTAPLRVSGGGSGQFRVKGGDNSVQNFGEEGGESELRAAAEALHAFFVARAEEDWPTACSYLAKTVRGQLEQLGARSAKLKGEGCAALLAALTAPLPSAARRETTVVDAGSLRHEGEQAFLIYYGAERAPYAIPMKPEGGAWKVAALAPVPLS